LQNYIYSIFIPFIYLNALSVIVSWLQNDTSRVWHYKLWFIVNIIALLK